MDRTIIIQDVPMIFTSKDYHIGYNIDGQHFNNFNEAINYVSNVYNITKQDAEIYVFWLPY